VLGWACAACDSLARMLMWPMSGYANRLPGGVLGPVLLLVDGAGAVVLPCRVLLLPALVVLLALGVGPLLLRCKVNVSTDSSLVAEVTANRWTHRSGLTLKCDSSCEHRCKFAG
jgi:hypothetical protein